MAEERLQKILAQAGIASFQDVMPRKSNIIWHRTHSCTNLSRQNDIFTSLS